MEALIWETADELDQKLASRLRNIRKRRAISQQRLEATGQISLLSLTKIAMALDLAEELRGLFTRVPYKNIEEVIRESR